MSTEQQSFLVQVVEEAPSDKWGNTATYSGIDLKDGYYQVGYDDDSFAQYEFPSDWEIYNNSDFIFWVQENHPDIISDISETLVEDGIFTCWRYITTNKPFDSKEWDGIVAEYAQTFA